MPKTSMFKGLFVARNLCLKVFLYLTSLLHEALRDNHGARDVLEKHNFISSLL